MWANSGSSLGFVPVIMKRNLSVGDLCSNGGSILEQCWNSFCLLSNGQFIKKINVVRLLILHRGRTVSPPPGLELGQCSGQSRFSGHGHYI